MKMKNSWKKVVAAVLTLACVITSVAVAPAKADAKAKSYKAYIMFTDKNWTVKNMNDGSKTPTIGSTKITGSGTYTVTLTKKALSKAYKKDPSGMSIWADGMKCEEGLVFNLDIVDIIKDYSDKKIKVSNISVKVDGKAIKVDSKKLITGNIEDDTKNYRVEFYNEYGDTKKNGGAVDPKKLKMKKSISVTFTIKY